MLQTLVIARKYNYKHKRKAEGYKGIKSCDEIFSGTLSVTKFRMSSRGVGCMYFIAQITIDRDRLLQIGR